MKSKKEDLRVLFVVSGKSGKLSPFVSEQIESLTNLGVRPYYFFIGGGGLVGYARRLFEFYKTIDETNPQIIHAHYGLSGLLANFQFRVPVITTFHGSDVNLKSIRPFSQIAHWLSNYSIFVAKKLAMKLDARSNYAVIPCGVDTKVFYPIDKTQARKMMGLPCNQTTILFGGAFTNTIKNAGLATAAVDLLGKGAKLIELKGYSRTEVNLLLNCSDLALITSYSEGSPQFLKEALACNCPVVATDVGDIRDIISEIKGCEICTYDPLMVAKSIASLLESNVKVDGRDKMVSQFDNQVIANKIMNVYTAISHGFTRK